LIWLRIGISGGLLWMRQELSSSPKCGEIFDWLRTPFNFTGRILLHGVI
jgi:hypothetical protein